MKTIKFKGVEVETGKTVYGDYCRNLSLPYPMIRSAELLKYVEVYPESVKQLVGFDKNGAELYEGDTILIDDAEMTIAEILPPHYLKFGELKK